MGSGDAVDAVAHGATDSCHMTSPWQHVMSMRIIWQNGESYTPTCKMRCTHPRLNCCHDNTKLAGHGPARYKMEWIYDMRTKVSGSDSLELALEMKKKERLRKGHFFEHLVLACTIVLMNDLGLNR